MKKEPIIFAAESAFPLFLEKKPKDMSKEELRVELLKRLDIEHKLKHDVDEQSRLLHELELHHLELEIQNRQITEAYTSLEAVTQKYVNLYDYAPVGYLTLDKKGKIIELNLTAARLLKCERNRIIGKSFESWIAKDSKRPYYDHLSKCLSRECETVICELVLKKTHESETFLQLHSTVSDEREGTIKVALIDVTEKKRADAAEELAYQLSEERKLREKYLSTLSHDLRTPLTSSKLCAQMLDGAMSDIGKKKKLYSLMVEELDRADRMIKELLDVSRHKGGENLPMMFKKCDLAKLAKGCIDNFQMVYPKTFVQFRSNGSIVGNWSKDGLQRVIENLLSNALKYGSKEHPVTLALEDLDDKIQMTVHNYGEAIPPREQKKIFEAFHRTQKAIHSEAIGWGLGLSLVHHIVDRHSGSIKVHSNETEGTSFIIVLPKKH